MERADRSNNNSEETQQVLACILSFGDSILIRFEKIIHEKTGEWKKTCPITFPPVVRAVASVLQRELWHAIPGEFSLVTNI